MAGPADCVHVKDASARSPLGGHASALAGVVVDNVGELRYASAARYGVVVRARCRAVFRVNRALILEGAHRSGSAWPCRGT